MQTLNNAKSIIKKLNDNGYEAYLVGGCVRDYLLELGINDYDITTSASPDTVECLFASTIPTGKDYGTISVKVDDEYYEVTTYRLENEYTDNRRPKSIKFAKSLEEDLMRRDFTINALAMDLEGNIIDYYDGIYDLENKLIKCVGDANDRFKEDNLRKLRAIRFATQKNFQIEKNTFQAIKSNSNLKGVSAERIQIELNKILLADIPSRGLKLLYKSNLLDEILPELTDSVGFNQNNKHHNLDVFDHICKASDSIDAEIELRLAAMLHDIGKTSVYSIDDSGEGHFIGHEKVSIDIASEILSRLKYSNKIKSRVLSLIKDHMKRPILEDKAIRRFIFKVGLDNLEPLMKLFKADALASNPEFYDEKLRYLDELEDILKKNINADESFSRKDLLINGSDLIEKFKSKAISGKSVGLILDHLLSLVIDDPSINRRDRLFDEANSFIIDKKL